jgi:MFS family permease
MGMEQNPQPAPQVDPQPEPQPQANPQAAPQASEPSTDIVEQSRFTFLALITRTIAAFSGGVAGTLALLFIYLLSSSILVPVFSNVEETVQINPLFVFVLMGMIFASTLVANLLSPLFISFTQKDKYKRTTTSLFQIFIMNIVIFVILSPVYLFSSGVGAEFMSYAAGLQIAFSVLASAMIFEIISNYRYAILGVYSTIFAILSGIAFNIMIYQVTGTATILLFVALPVLWGGAGFVHGLVIMIYQWVVATWGTDFLSTAQEYSKDYGITEEEVPQVVDLPAPKDEEGVDFLRKEDTPEEQNPPEQNPPEQQV